MTLRRRSRVAVLAALVTCALVDLAPVRASGQPILAIDLPLDDEAEVRRIVGAYGGTVRGGVFEEAGWRTSTRDDAIEIPLPDGVPAGEGTLTLVFTTPYLPAPMGWFEAYHLVSLDTSGTPFRATPTGAPGVQILYVLHDETGVVRQAARGYFNLMDPGCVDWRACTAEAASERYWLRDADEHYRVEHRWAGPRDELTFTARGATRTQTMDLSASSPSGRIAADHLVLSINPCGGSTHPHCGQWDGPERGGPLGLTYVSARLELRAVCGDGTCSRPVEGCGCSIDCGSCPGGDAGVARADAGLAVESDAGSDAGSGPAPDAAVDAGAAAPDGRPAPDAGPARPSGGCTVGPTRGAAEGWLLVFVLSSLRHRRGSERSSSPERSSGRDD